MTQTTIFDRALGQLLSELSDRVIALRPDNTGSGAIGENTRLIIVDDRTDVGLRGFSAAQDAGALDHVGLFTVRRAPQNLGEATRFLEYARDIVLRPPPAILPDSLQTVLLIVTAPRPCRSWLRYAIGHPSQ